MKRNAIHIALILLIIFTSGCGSDRTVNLPGSAAGIAILSLDDSQKNLAGYEWDQLQKVINWMDRDLSEGLRRKGFAITRLDDLKSYRSTMGYLFIVNVEYFNAGYFYNRPRNAPKTGPSSLELSYKVLDERGALLADWQDGVDSLKGGTYCAQTLNRRAVKKITPLLSTQQIGGE